MDKRIALIIALLAVLLAVAVPIGIALHVAKREGEQAEKELASGYAQRVLLRAEETADQVNEAIEKLLALRAAGQDPCSPDSLTLMRQIDIGSSYIQAIGHVEGNRLVCSSIDPDHVGLDLGAVDLVLPTGVKLRNQVRLPFDQTHTFLVIERDGYAAIIHKSLPIDIHTPEKDLSVAALSGINAIVTASRGPIKPKWLAATRDLQDKTFIDDSHVVAIAVSQRHHIEAIAALPVANLTQRIRNIAFVLVPAGMTTGVILALAVIYLARQRFELPAEIRAALANREFFLVYQPLVDLRDGRWIGAEALIRWRRHNGELIPPDLFIPVADRVGLIQQITSYTMRAVAEEAGDLFARFPDFHLSINLAAADLHDHTTLAKLHRLAADTNAGPGNLVVEATERSYADPAVAARILHALRATGVQVAIDDFGTGYSSLSYLEKLEIDYLKIDKSFVDSVGTGAATSQVILHIIGMARSLGLKMIAEGVETEAQAAFLRAQGVQYAQGWLYAKGMPMPELVRNLEAQAAAATTAPDLPAGG